MKVRVLKVYKSKETGKATYVGQELEYPDNRAADLASGGWVEIVGEKNHNAGPESPEKKETAPGRKKRK